MVLPGSGAVQSRTTLATISDASKAPITAMRLRSRPSFEVEAVHTSDVALDVSLRNAQMNDDFITEFVLLVEETELYFKDADPTQNLEQLTETSEKATRFRLALHSSSASSRTDIAHYQLPKSGDMSADSFGREFSGHLSSMSDDTSMRLLSFDHIQGITSGLSHTSPTGHQITPRSQSDLVPSNKTSLQDHSRDNDKIVRMSMPSMADAVTQLDNAPCTKDHIILRGRSKVSRTMDPKTSLSCSFDFALSEESVLLKIIPTNGPHGTPDALVASGALLPPSDPSSKRSQFRSQSTQTMSPRSFQHFFQSRDRPIPHFLHPDVEGPTEEPDAPYTITFKERQYLSSGYASGQARWTISLMYIFHENEDRITLCEMIFGKSLLITAGSDRINYDGQEISPMSAVALWFDEASETQSMTFFPNLTGKTATPKDVELKIHGLWDPTKKTSRNPKALAIIAELIPSDEEGLNISVGPNGRSSVQSGGTILSKASSAPSKKMEEIWKFEMHHPIHMVER